MGAQRFTPMGDRVLLQCVKEAEYTPSGLVIPDSARERSMEARVVAVGDGPRGDNGQFHAIRLQEGQRVLLARNTGLELKVGGEDFVLVRTDDILGVLDG